MAHLDLTQPDSRPLVPLKRFVDAHMTRIRQMLVASFIAAATIILVAASLMVAF